MPESSSTSNGKPAWEKIADDLTSNPLKTTRDVADKWITVLSALVGLTTVFGLIQGRDALNKLDVTPRFVLVSLFLAALLVSVAAIFLAALASEGSPKNLVYDHTSGSYKKSFSEWYHKATERAVARLRLSRVLAFVSLGLVVAALFVSWFAPGPPSTETSVLVLRKSGAFVCGTLKGATGNAGSFSLTVHSETITLNDVVSFTVVSSCP